MSQSVVNKKTKKRIADGFEKSCGFRNTQIQETIATGSLKVSHYIQNRSGKSLIANYRTSMSFSLDF